MQTSATRMKIGTGEEQLHPQRDGITSDCPAGLHIPAARPDRLTAQLCQAEGCSQRREGTTKP